MESNPMQKLNDLSRSLTPLKPDGTLIAVIEMSLSSWLVAGIVPGIERQPLKKLDVDENALLKLLNRWREEAQKAGQGIERIAIALPCNSRIVRRRTPTEARNGYTSHGQSTSTLPDDAQPDRN